MRANLARLRPNLTFFNDQQQQQKLQPALLASFLSLSYTRLWTCKVRTEEKKTSLCYGGKSPKLHCNPPVFWDGVVILAPEHKKTRLAGHMPYVVAVRLVSLNLVHGHFKRWLAAIVGIGLHAQPDCVATTGFHNKVSTVPESPWPERLVEQKFEIQIQIF